MRRNAAAHAPAAVLVGLVRIAIGAALLYVGRHGGIGWIALAVGGILVALGLIRLVGIALLLRSERRDSP